MENHHSPTADYRERALGCLLGLAVGDAMGDLGRSDPHRQRYGIITHMADGARSTDDTEFAILTAQMLIDWRGELTLERVAQSWRKYILGQGGMGDRGGKPLYGAVANLARGIEPPISGTDTPQNDDDGAAMRIAPVGIVCPGNPQRAAALASIDAQISNADDGVWAAQAVAASIAVALDDASPDETVAAGREHIPQNSWLGRALSRALEICRSSDSMEDAWLPLHDALWNPVHSMAAEAIPQAYAIFLLTQGDFRRGMFWACNFGRDADTIAAIVGALSGARQGQRVIPADWIEKVRRPAGVCLKFAAQRDIPEVVEQLIEVAYARA
jgi:ADP-ribosylglycohydrolase